MSSSLAKKISHSLSSCLYLNNGFPYCLQSLRHHPLRFASFAASAAYAREPYKPKPKPVLQSATKTPLKVSPPSSTLVSYSKKLNEKPKTTNNETLSSSVISKDKSIEKSSEQELPEVEWDDEPEWFKELGFNWFKKLGINEEPFPQDLPEHEMEGVDWLKIRPTEYRNGEIVYKIIDNPGEKKITLLRECEKGEQIKLSAKMPQDGHHFDYGYVYTFVRVKKGNECQNFYTYSWKGISNHVETWMAFVSETNQLSEYESEEFLRRRGIDESLVEFLQEYMIKKILKEKLFPCKQSLYTDTSDEELSGAESEMNQSEEEYS